MKAEDLLPRYCEFLIRFIAARMLDPHRHFEQQLLGELSLANNPAERERLFRRLASWTAPDRLLDQAQAGRLDSSLADAGLPSASLARGDPELVVRLLGGRADAASRAEMEAVLHERQLLPGDRRLIAARLAPYRQ